MRLDELYAFIGTARYLVTKKLNKLYVQIFKIFDARSRNLR